MTISVQNILPDPNYRYGDHGQDDSGPYGPGFKSVKLESQTKIARNETNSGRLVSRSHGNHKWSISISYNPMTREEFEPVYSFLLSRQLSLKPFFVSLPHLRSPRDTTFKNYIETPFNIDADADTDPGQSSILLNGFTATSGSPKPGDLFHIRDNDQSSHFKAYQVVSVQDASNNDGTTIGTTQRKIEFRPALTKKVFEDALFHFSNPLIRVVMKGDVQQYALDDSGLYKFSLRLEEAQP